MLKLINIKADGLIGHSVGELACSYADGCLTAEQMVLAAYYRGKASLEADLIKGMMAAVGGYQNEYYFSSCSSIPDGVRIFHVLKLNQPSPLKTVVSIYVKLKSSKKK